MQLSAQEIKSEINVTPLVDVVLVLLIIFMVATPMIVSRSVELPVTSNPVQEVMETLDLIAKSGFPEIGLIAKPASN